MFRSFYKCYIYVIGALFSVGAVVTLSCPAFAQQALPHQASAALKPTGANSPALSSRIPAYVKLIPTRPDSEANRDTRFDSLRVGKQFAFPPQIPIGLCDLFENGPTLVLQGSAWKFVPRVGGKAKVQEENRPNVER